MENLKSVVVFLEDWGALCLAALSFVVSVTSLRKASKAQSLQSQVNELDCRLKQYELDAIEKKKATENMACVEVRVIKPGTGKYRLKVWNSGNATAYNVNAHFESDIGIYIMEDNKLPYEELGARKSFELALIVSGNSESKFTIITEWIDADGGCRTKSQLESI